MADLRFEHPSYTVRRKVFKLFGGTFHIHAPSGELIFYSKMKAFKLKEDIRLYTGTDMQTEALVIKARQVLDFSAAYDVYDPALDEKVGALKRKGLKSLIRDEWVIMDADDLDVGTIQEDSTALALVRRFVLNLIPQTYYVTMAGVRVSTLRHHFNPFVTKISVDFGTDASNPLDRRLGVAAAVLLCAIEGKQS